MTSLQNSSLLVVAAVLLVTSVQAGFIDLFTDADYKGNFARIENVEADYCYNLCDGLNNTITSARWDNLPEKTSNGDDTMISFYVDRDCQNHNIWWRTKTQSDDDLYFPSNFKLDGINDQISSFMVWNTKKIITSFAVIGASITPEPFSGDIEFYRDVNSKHILGTMKIKVANRCYNLDCGNLNDNISSVTWSGLPEKATYDGQAEAQVAFYVHNKCAGSSQRFSTTRGGVSSFTVAGINDVVSSFMLLQFSAGIENGTRSICELADKN
ncbi:hypothetical protein PC129_g11548 [Phytophthora cactorum]|uniref:Concanavalin A-like lectin/glucanase domain n=1 Tax=Phytophthora cactorum TaxID=29920 RepID=A0A329SG19_9STRA|nr:hypothetical protein Pcac1_g22029 [Phytophthora cactorum]KAG2815632.1 hypothetical protein PC112_g13785 [Phytophthora cactorum]KAG2817120.1 hypothetical protein PC111_g12840 [Phytophthora cactorum]KAG2853886.1 hypothetical protein PC113_g13781 [Phytophthora cactorum]KAG2898009.1 hypothetical protein PC114_g14458 [Phytophthora cactorum]